MHIKWIKGCPYVYKGDKYLGSYFKWRFLPSNRGKMYTDDIITTPARHRSAGWTTKQIGKINEIDKLARAAEKKAGDLRRKRKKTKR